jgi:L-lactate dehydrogenase complex protein LldE
MANAGCTADARQLARRFVSIFKSFDYIVAPSGSCVAMVRHHYNGFFDGDGDGDGDGDPDFVHVRQRTYELCEFLVDVLQVTRIPGSFPHIVGLHQSCHGLRELRMGRSTERMDPHYNKPRQLLAGLDGIRFAPLQRADECCGFGGTFAIAEEAVSCMMGLDRLADHEQAGTEVLTSADMSCLMHLDGLNRRRRKPMHVMHIAQILAGRTVRI